MSSWRCVILFGFLLLAATASGFPARETAPGAPEPPPMPPAGKKLDPWKLPADALLEITPEKLQELLDKIARLEGKLRLAPAKCQLLNGRIEDGVVLFKIDFVVRAERPDAVFALGCGQAKVKSAQQDDGRTPMLSSDGDGFLVQVEKTGEYKVSLDVSLPLSQRPNGGRGFELDLPRAVITLLEMDLPADARALRINGTDLSALTLAFKNNRLEGPLGPVSKLDLTWQGDPPSGVGPLQTARAHVAVRLEDGWMTTDAELLLHAQGGPVKQWGVVVPPGFEVKASQADQQRVQINRTEESGSVRYTALLKEPSDADLTLTATARTPVAAGKRAAIGPFLVRGATRQSGVVVVSAPASTLLRPNADLSPRDPTDEEKRANAGLTAVYEYGAAATTQPWLEVEAGSPRGSIKTQVVYALTLRPSAAGVLEWQATARFTVSPLVGAGVDHLEVQLPSNFELLPSALPDEVTKPDPESDRMVLVQLNKESSGLFTGSIKGRYTNTLPPLIPGKLASLPLWLPRPVRDAQTRDGSGQIDVTVPEDVELAAPPDAENVVKEVHKLSWRLAPNVDKVEVLWKPYQPEMRLSSVIDLTLNGQTADVQHELHLHFPRSAPKQLTLRTAEALGRSLEVIAGGSLVDDAAAPVGSRTLKLQGTGQDQTVTLKYSFPLRLTPLAMGEKGGAGEDKAFDAPLAVVDQATDGVARVRVWCDADRLPLPPGGDWSELDVELVPGKNRLPVLVLGSRRPDAPLRLILGDPTGQAAATVLVDRALLRADLVDGDWDIRASYLIRRLAAPTLDVELPSSASKVRVKFAGLDVNPQSLEESPQGSQDRRLYRLGLPGALGQWPMVLEVDFKIQASRASQGAGPTTLQPPLLDGDHWQAPTRWQVVLPSDYVALSPEGGAGVRWTLGWRSWLPAPRLAVTNADLEQWFAGADLPDWPQGTADHPSLDCRQDAGQPLTVAYFFPEWGWLTVCSVPLLILGLLLFVLARRAYAGRRWSAFWFWTVAVLLPPAIGAVWAFRPTILYAIAYGCEPGTAVLLVFLLIQALMLERYRRQIVFLPNFRRARTGSSLVRANGSQHRPAGEPSTIDAPRTAGSSQQPG